MEKNQIVFGQVCIKRANEIWWSARTALIPADVINVIAQDDDEYMKLMDEREKCLHDSFFATCQLQKMSREYSSKNDEAATKQACADVALCYQDVIEANHILTAKFEKLEQEFQSKKEQSDEQLIEKSEKHKSKLIHERGAVKGSKKKSNK